MAGLPKSESMFGTCHGLRPWRAISRRIIVSSMSVSLVCTFRSYSLLMRRLRESQPKVRTTTHLLGSTLLGKNSSAEPTASAHFSGELPEG
jgi:hypothetical protein